MRGVLCGITCTELVPLLIPEALAFGNGLRVGPASSVLPTAPLILVRGLGLSPQLELVLGPIQLPVTILWGC